MARTVTIFGSDEVMAMFGSAESFYRGKWQDVKVTGVSTDESAPLEVRKSLVGLVVPTIFTKERIEEQTGAKFPEISEGTRLAYCPDVIEVLKSAGKNEAAEQLENVSPNPLDMYTLEKEIYEIV